MASSQSSSFDKSTKLGVLPGVGARYLFAHKLLLKYVDYILSTLNKSVYIGAFLKFRAFGILADFHSRMCRFYLHLYVSYSLLPLPLSRLSLDMPL